MLKSDIYDTSDRLAVFDNEYTVHLYDRKTRQEFMTIPNPLSNVNERAKCVAYSKKANAIYLLTTDDKILFYDTKYTFYFIQLMGFFSIKYTVFKPIFH